MSRENPGFVRIRIFLIYIQFVTPSDEEKHVPFSLHSVRVLNAVSRSVG
jgi:hypothetical protein